MSTKHIIPAEGLLKIIVEEIQGDCTIQGWERPEVQAEGDDSVHVDQDGSTLLIRFDSDGQLFVPHQLELEIQEVHGDLSMMNIRAATDLATVHGDARLQHVGTIQLQDVHGDLSINESSGPLLIDSIGGDLNVRGLSEHIRMLDVGGDARIHGAGAVSARSIGGDLTLRDTRGATQVENVGGDLHTSQLHGDCKITIGGDLKAGEINGNLDCTVGGDAVVRAVPRHGQAYRINAGGEIRCRLSAEADVTINATAGGTVRVDQLPIQKGGDTHSLQAILGNGSAAMDLIAGGDIVLAGIERNVEWSFDFGEDFAEEWGEKAAGFAERIAQQIEHQVSHLTRQLDDRISYFANNEELASNIQEKVQKAMQRAEEKINEAMRKAEERSREAEARAAERQARHEERARRHEERQQQVRPQYMHHPRPVAPVAPPVPPMPTQAPAVSSEERMMILKMLSEGQITVEQADQLLAALGGKVEV